MSRSRDIAKFLSKTEVSNTSNVRLFQSNEAVGLDSGQVQNVGLQKFTTLDSLPSTGLTSGQQAWVESSGRLYISNGSGWYNVALINATPSLTLDQSGTIQLNADTLSVTVIASATDSDDNQDMITFSAESDGNMVGTGVTLSQDSSVFTFTSLSADSGGVAGDFTITFKATDGIAVDNETLDFSLAFSNVVDSSSGTVLLMKADGNSENNAAITYQNSSNATVGFTETGTPQASTFSPYRSGGYSGYFDDTTYTTDWLEVDHDAGLSVGSSNFTIEGWVYLSSITNNDALFGKWHQGSIAGRNEWLIYVSGGQPKFIYSTGGTNTTDTLGMGTFSTNTWHHFAVVRNGSTITTYLDGTSQDTSSIGATAIYTATATPVRVGRFNSGGGLDGYVHDYRIVKGTAVYTSNFTPPTEPLEAITNTELLFMSKGHYGYADKSTNGHEIEANGDMQTQPFAPYDYEPWTADDHGGSVYFDGSDKVETASDINAIGTSSYTFEAWVRFANSASANETVMEWNDATTNVTSSRIIFGRKSTGVPRLYLYNADKTISAPTMQPNIWYHLALVRNGSTTKVYVDGVERYTQADTQDASNVNRLRIGRNRDNAEPMTGHIADLRYTKDARYTAAFTPPTAPMSHSGSASHVHMQNKSDANIYDASATHTFTQIDGDPVSSTTQRKFSTSSSVHFDGSDQLRIDDGLLTPSEFGTDDWTIEGWIYSTSSNNQYVWGDVASSGANSSSSHFLYYQTSGITAYNYTNANVTLTGSEATAANTWHHIAVTREGSTFRLFVNGVLDASATNSVAMNNSTVKYAIGGIGDFNSKFTGYIQDFRITKGKARYTATFTPPTAEFEL